MNEITTTRHNDGIDPFMHVWGWEIPVYLFLGGLVAGMMILSGYLLYNEKYKPEDSISRYIPIFSIIFLSLGMGALFLDLEHRLFTWRLYTTFKITSPMSWGAWILLLVYPSLIANILVEPPAFLINKFSIAANWTAKIKANESLVKKIGLLNILLGIMLGIYTGVLLSSMGSRPLWNSSILWLLFLVSGLSTAAAFIHMISKNKEESETFAKADNIFLITELAVIILLIIGLLSSSGVHIQAVQLLLSGKYAPQFWVFVVGIGILLPLIIQTKAVKHKIKHTPAAPLFVLAGGLILRFIIVYAGQFSHYMNAHFR